MSENQNKIKFERTDKDTWSKVTDKQSHNNSIVFIESVEDGGSNQIWSNGHYYGVDIVKDKKETSVLSLIGLDKNTESNDLIKSNISVSQTFEKGSVNDKTINYLSKSSIEIPSEYLINTASGLIGYKNFYIKNDSGQGLIDSSGSIGISSSGSIDISSSSGSIDISAVSGSVGITASSVNIQATSTNNLTFNGNELFKKSDGSIYFNNTLLPMSNTDSLGCIKINGWCRNPDGSRAKVTLGDGTRNYGVNIDINGLGYVNVPWTDTTVNFLSTDPLNNSYTNLQTKYPLAFVESNNNIRYFGNNMDIYTSDCGYLISKKGFAGNNILNNITFEKGDDIVVYPNIFTNIQNKISQDLTLSFQNANSTTSEIAKWPSNSIIEYQLKFTVSENISTDITVNFTGGNNTFQIKWRNGQQPSFLPGKTYIMSFLMFGNNLNNNTLYCNYSIFN